MWGLEGHCRRCAMQLGSRMGGTLGGMAWGLLEH